MKQVHQRADRGHARIHRQQIRRQWEEEAMMDPNEVEVDPRWDRVVYVYDDAGNLEDALMTDEKGLSELDLPLGWTMEVEEF